jgi:GTP cyclohydrolase I
MSEISALDSDERQTAVGVSANGDNSIPRGGEARIVSSIAGHMEAVMRELNLDLDDPNYEGTPERVAKMYLEMFHGLREGAEPKVTTFPNEEGYHHMVIEKEIPFYSMCAHHFVPFYGHAHIAYIPESTIVGLSKLPRILEFYAKRPQLQERLTEQVAEFLWSKLKPQGVMVVIEARHLCVEMRGVKKAGALTTTSALRGCFADRMVRDEFLALLRREAAW